MKNIIILSNGKKVANFSSPHPFEFEDGTILPAVSNEEANRLKVDFIEDDHGNGDIELSFSLSEEVREEMDEWIELLDQGQVDVVFVAMPMMVAMKELYGTIQIKSWPFRAIRMTDRITKKVSITKQCL